MNGELAYAPAWWLRDEFQAKRLSPVEVAGSLLRRIEALNPRLNVYLTVTADVALAAARAAEAKVQRGETLGPLEGVPVSVKDLFATAGIRTTFGSLAFKDHVPTEDAVTVERVRAAGMAILGKTNSPEFGMAGTTENRLGEPCRDPWDLGRTSGGSSGGAAAVAAGLGVLGLGGDGAGSIRIPCSFCGLFGLKPTRGRVPRSGGMGAPVANQFTHYGPMTWWVRDAALLLEALAGYDRRDPLALREPAPDVTSTLGDGVKGLRIAWSTDLGYAEVDPEVVEVCARGARVFEELGASLEEPPIRLEHPMSYFLDMFEGGSYVRYQDLYHEQPELLTDYVREVFGRGSEVTLARYLRAARSMEVLGQQMGELFDAYDLLLTPTMAVPAFPIGQRPLAIAGRPVHPYWGYLPFTPLFNMTGQPAATVPAGFSREGLPIGLHVIGRVGADATVLRAAYAFEQARPWQNKMPDLV